MTCELLTNDPLLSPFIEAADSVESERQLMLLLSEHAETRIRAIISARLSPYCNIQAHQDDYDDVCSEVRTRLVAYLCALKDDPYRSPCKDFLGYIAAVAHNACHDYFRQMHPARARLSKKIRDRLNGHRTYSLWKSQRDTRGDWVCGLKSWEGEEVGSNSTAFLRRFYEDPQAVIESLSHCGDIKVVDLGDLIGSIFEATGEPIGFADVVSLVWDIRGTKEFPVASIDTAGANAKWRINDGRVQVDSALKTREPLLRVWEALGELPDMHIKAYLLYARDGSGEDLINLFLDTEIATDTEVAELLSMTVAELFELRVNRLPLDNKAISKLLGVTEARVYRLRYQASKYLKSALIENTPKKKWRKRKKRAISPSHDQER